jgi:plasmid stability protein
MVQSRSIPLRALTVRLPEDEYNLLRAMAFSHDRSINDVVRLAIQNLIEASGGRPPLAALLETAMDIRRQRGKPSGLPRNPTGRGPR